ncbi:hypothetical protein GCM10009765_74080 [Fodinicola feengrottensis]|uniref:Uncharacterized protein n=1 Tax=Fodinicola feengrottensis TaxID=435914 RepID=A0ABN2IYB9_9ACTN
MASIKTGAVVVSWGAAIPGREAGMLRVLKQALGYVEQLRGEGRIEDSQLYVSKTGPNRDTLMLTGQLDRLAALLAEDDFEDLLQDGMLVVQDVQVALWAGGAPRAIAEGIDVHAGKMRDHGLL